METVFIDGGMGEGGGQILRTSLALACITGKALHIE
ncbi:MAG: RNA 3'-terminal phosphate cyclase, partial [Sedimentisphaerales bacterium]